MSFSNANCVQINFETEIKLSLWGPEKQKIKYILGIVGTPNFFGQILTKS